MATISQPTLKNRSVSFCASFQRCVLRQDDSACIFPCLAKPLHSLLLYLLPIERAVLPFHFTRRRFVAWEPIFTGCSARHFDSHFPVSHLGFFFFSFISWFCVCRRRRFSSTLFLLSFGSSTLHPICVIINGRRFVLLILSALGKAVGPGFVLVLVLVSSFSSFFFFYSLIMKFSIYMQLVVTLFDLCLLE